VFRSCRDYPANLTAADLTQADLSNAHFEYALLTDANFTGADVRGANFRESSITLEQLYSTASFRLHDLSGIDLSGRGLVGANFSGQNLSDAAFVGAALTDADFNGAVVRGSNFDTVYLYGPYGPYVGPGITLAQLYSTASYQTHDLSGIDLSVNNLAGGN